MKEEVLNLIKEDYRKYLERINNILMITEQISSLEGFDTLKEYLRLKIEKDLPENIELTDKSNFQILDLILKKYQPLITETNEIYVYLGSTTTKNKHNNQLKTSSMNIKRNEPQEEFRIYKNIENGQCLQIPITQCYEFENTHYVIIPNTKDSEQYFYKIQRKFISLAITDSQKSACQKVLRRNKKQ